MATTWDAVSEKLWRFLDDVLEEDETAHNYDQELLILSWNYAQRHFTHHTPRQVIKVGLVVKDDQRTVVLPGDFYAFGRLYDPVSCLWWRKMQYQPGGYHNATIDEKTVSIWGNVMYLYEDVPQDNSFALWYYAYWPEIEYKIDDDEVVITAEEILTPQWAEPALIFLSAAFVFQPGAAEAGDVRNWNMKIDSGTPLDNPREKLAWDLYSWYTTLISGRLPYNGSGHE